MNVLEKIKGDIGEQADLIQIILGGPKVVRRTAVASPLEFHNTISAGLPAISFVAVATFLEISREALAAAMGVPPRTIYRRLEEKKKLDPVQTEKLVRIARVTAAASTTFLNSDKGREWIKRPNRALSGKRPIDLLDNEAGAELVDDILGRIREGIVG